MRLPENLAFILLAVWLILEGLIMLLGLTFAGLNIVMGILALIAGIILLFDHVGAPVRRRR